ncbi:unnamed protein product [Arctogadus glacialis]
MMGRAQKPALIQCSDPATFAEQLNTYYSRFNMPHPQTLTSNSSLTVDKGKVTSMLGRINLHKASGPDRLRGKVDCLGNVMRVIAGPLGLNFLEVSVGYNNSIIPVTQRLASQCGISLWNHPGHIELYVSLQNCFAHNVEDREFTTTLNLRVYGATDDEETYHDRHSSAFQIKAIVFFSPDERPMSVTQALGKGYGVTNGPTRLVVRGSPTAPEAYQQDVAGVPMTILHTSTIFEKKWIASQIDTAVACPTGGFSVTDDTISWFMPRHIDPLISADRFKLLEVHMGVNGQRLDAEEMAARQYTLVINDVHIITKIPVGAIGGYMKVCLTLSTQLGLSFTGACN